MAPKQGSLAGSGYVILNCIRVLNVVALLSTIAGSIAMLIKTSVGSSLFFFDALTNVVAAFFATFLLVSELSLFTAYYTRNMPLLGPEHGFVTLSLAMFILGIDLLAKLNHEQNSQEKLGLAFWRMVISAGIIIFIMAFVNFVASYVFRDRKQGITARQVRAHGAVASHMTPSGKAGSFTSPSKSSTFDSSHLRSSPATPDRDASPTTARNPLRLVTDHHRLSGSASGSPPAVQPDPILPSYHASTDRGGAHHRVVEPPSPSSRYSRATFCSRKNGGGFSGFNFGRLGRRESLAPPLPVNISAPLGCNPQFAHLVPPQRPDSAMHPAKTNEREPFRWRVSRGD